MARGLFIAGAAIFIVLGFGHGVGTLFDVWWPRVFTPVDDGVRRSMQRSGVRLYPPRDMWNAWLGFNISHGLGAFVIGLLLLLVAIHDFDLIRSVPGVAPTAIGVAAVYLVLSLRFWFWGPALGAALALTLISVGVAL